jgi:hypothetical protein
MSMTLTEAASILTNYIRVHWSDEKLAHIFAFAQDGHMSFGNACACFLGVDTSTTLHTSNCSKAHYLTRKYPNGILNPRDENVWQVENAYWWLSDPPIHEQENRTRHFIALLEAEIRRRDSLKAPVCVTPVSNDSEVLTYVK